MFANPNCMHKSSFLTALDGALNSKNKYTLLENDAQKLKGRFEHDFHIGRLITIVLSEEGRESTVFLLGREKQVGPHYSFTRLIEINTFLGEILKKGIFQYETCSVNWNLKREDLSLKVEFKADITNTYLEFRVQDDYLRYEFNN